VATGSARDVVHRLFATLDAQDLISLENDVMAPGYRLHFDSLPTMDRTAAIGFFGAFLVAFPDITHSVEDIFSENGRVACRLVVRGTHTGDFMGIPPTNRSVEIHAINVHHIEGGCSVEHWVNSDGMGMLMQLGVIPAPDQKEGN
jgi:hypothetical protein